jgi:DNA adenine methylase
MADISLKNAFSRMGGKSKLAEFIVSKFPKEYETYVEPFIGGGSVFFRKNLSNKNVINDIVEDIYDMYCDLRDVEDIQYIFDKTNMSETEFIRLRDMKRIDNKDGRLFRNLYLTKNSFGGNRKKYGYSDGEPDNRRVSSLTYIKKHLKDYQYKLKKTEVLNEDYKSIIQRFDADDTFFYLDPPYSKNTKSWRYDTPILTKEELEEELSKIKGKFIMSYDYNDENIAFFGKRFQVLPVDTIYAVQTKGREKKFKELLISNFKIE